MTGLKNVNPRQEPRLTLFRDILQFCSREFGPDHWVHCFLLAALQKATEGLV